MFPRIQKPFISLLLSVAILLPAGFAYGREPSAQKPSEEVRTTAPQKSPAEIFAACLMKLAAVIDPTAGTPAEPLSAHVKIVELEGGPSQLAGLEGDLAYLAPDRLKLSTTVDGNIYAFARQDQKLGIIGGKLALLGSPDVPRFAAKPDEKDGTRLEPFRVPLQREQLAIAPFFFKIEARPSATIDGVNCHVLRVTPLPEAAELLKTSNLQLDLWIRETDSLPARIGFSDLKDFSALVEFTDIKLGGELPADTWKLNVPAGTKVERVALSHITKFFEALVAKFTQEIPTLGPATGEHKNLATTEGGRLDEIDGTKVLFLKGTPEEMGRQHGELMKNEAGDLVDSILYGVGVGSSFAKGTWFFGEIEGAVKRLEPFIQPRHQREMDALAAASGKDREEVRLANFFPELFHCSGFALYGDATEGGRMYHGRILDYLMGMGLEQNAVVIVSQPDEGNAWVNLGYAGFIGTITAMNEKHISIGEMGGRGEGDWDGKPMAQLMREVMENADTLDEAVEIMRKGPRTCAYYYVIADGNTKRAVGIAATPTTFEVIEAGESHPLLPNPSKDTVLMSAGSRYEELAKRVKDGFGKFDDQKARDLMTRPVCMNSNIQSVLFAPETLDFWVANADAKNVASHTRYTHYNLAELLKDAPPAASKVAAAGAQ